MTFVLMLNLLGKLVTHLKYIFWLKNEILMEIKEDSHLNVF